VARRAHVGGGPSGRVPRGLANEARWAEILEAAATVFDEKGYKAATLHEVAASVGLLPGSLYYYIRSKEDLLFALVEGAHAQGVAATAEDEVTAAAEAPERLRSFVQRWMVVLEATAPLGAVESNMAFLADEHRRRVHERRRHLHAFVRGIVAQGIAEGAFDPAAHPGVVTNSLFAVLTGTRTWASPDGRLTYAEIGDWYVRLHVRGLARPARRRAAAAAPRTAGGARPGALPAVPQATAATTSTPHDVRWEEILDAAAEEFRVAGFKAARLHDIAARVGLLTGSLYHYLSSKEELLHALMRDAHQQAIDRVVDAVVPEAPADQQLAALIRAWAVLPPPPRHDIVERDVRFLTPPHRRAIEELRLRLHELARGVVVAGIADGTFASDLDPGVATCSLTSILNGTRTWWRPSGQLSAGELHEWYATFFRRGFGPAGPRAGAGRREG